MTVGPARRDDVDVESFLSNLERLQAVQATGRMDAPSEELDELSRSAAAHLGAPIALVSLLDDERQYFAGQFFEEGVDETSDRLAAARQTSLDYSYCKHVVSQDNAFVVEDARDDDLVRDHLANTELGYRSYLGVPLRRGGQVLGAFCVVDTGPRQWTDLDLETLEALAAQATDRL